MNRSRPLSTIPSTISALNVPALTAALAMMGAACGGTTSNGDGFSLSEAGGSWGDDGSAGSSEADGSGANDGGPTDAGRDGSTGSDAPTDASAGDADTPDGTDDDAGYPLDGTPVEPSGDASDADAGGTSFVPPTCDGVIAPGEYGKTVDGTNQQTTSTGQTWFMTFSDQALYVAIANATTSEGAVVYVSTDPAVPSDGGTASSGMTSGVTYDQECVTSLPVRVRLVAYVKDSYNEIRVANAEGGWSSAQANRVTACMGDGGVREWSIPWTAFGNGRPPSFGWLGYLTSSTGYVYGAMPQGNPSGDIGTSATSPWLYLVTDTGSIRATPPFADAVDR